MSTKRKPNHEGASHPNWTPEMLEETRRLADEQEAAMSETELRAHREAERKQLDKEHRAQRKKNAGGSTGDDADAGQPSSNPDDEAARRLLEAEQRQVEEANERNPVLPSLRTNPFGAATIVLDHYFTKDDVRLLVYYREDWYQYKNQRWVQVAKKDVESALYKRLLLCRQVDAEGEIHDFVTSKPNLDTIYFQIEKNETIPSDMAVPCVREPDGSWREVDGQGRMVCRGEIVDMLSGKSRPTLYTFVPNGADWRYDPDATEPERWHQFLAELFGDKADEIALLQEWFGYVLSGDRWAQKALLIVGPKRAGKGTIGHVLKYLLGKSMVSSPTINGIGDRFGLEDSINKRLLLVSDAKLSSKKDTMAVIAEFLRIIGNDPVMVDRKNKQAVTIEPGVRVMILSNEMPQFTDTSDAISSRFLILQLGQSFFDREDHQLLDKLTDELPGIALWAMEGYRRLRERGRFNEPESSKQAREDLYETGNPLQRFLDEWCVIDPKAYVTNPDLYAAYCEWCEAEGIKHPDPRNTMKKKINMMLGDKIKTKSTTNKAGDDVKVNCGLGLKSKQQF